MHASSLLVLLAVLAASAAAFSPIAFQSEVGSDGTSPYVTSVRFSNLGFTSYKPTTKYVAFFCDTRADLVTVTADMAVVRLTNRPPPQTCPLSLWEKSMAKRVYVGAEVIFTPAPFDNAAAVTLDVTPSFYLASRLTPTRVRVIGPGLDSATKVVGAQGEGPCLYIQRHQDGFSCALPALPASRIRPNSFIEFVVTTAHGKTRFAIQALHDEPLVEVDFVAPHRLHSGTRFTLTLTAPLSTVGQLPWAPVLSNAVTGVVADGATFSSLQWGKDGRELTATVECATCTPGLYVMGLGESLRGLAAPVIPGSVTVSFSRH